MSWRRIHVGRDPSRARLEFLHTNGAGAYASSTIAGMHSRRYHGLLVAALGDPLERREGPREARARRGPERGPLGRYVVLSHVDATLYEEDGRGEVVRSWELAKHRFPGVDPDRTPLYLERFEQAPLPRWTHRTPLGELETTLALVRGRNAVVLRYQWRPAPEAAGRPMLGVLRPLLAMRHFHELAREFGGMQQSIELRASGGALPGRMRVQPRRELPPVTFLYRGTFVGSPDWWRRFEYGEEAARGLDFHEDLWTPGVVEVVFDEKPLHVVASVGEPPDEPPDLLIAQAIQALEALPAMATWLAQPPASTPEVVALRDVGEKLVVAAEAFRATLAPTPWTVAGFPWFELWGRDTLISFRGLYLLTGHEAEGVRVLDALLDLVRDGVVPNRVEDGTGAVDDASADATLWLLALASDLAPLSETGQAARDFVLARYFPAAREIVRAIADGRHPRAGLDARGFLRTRGSTETLTWMDARVGRDAVTPRVGCPIELTALWGRGLEALSRLAREAGSLDFVDECEAHLRRLRAARNRFYCAETGYAFDVLPALSPGDTDDDSAGDRSVRPNAILAIADFPELFSEAARRTVLRRARRELLTPAGLRTLPPSDPRYQAAYVGGPKERDRAYHQGTAWPWLLGAWVRATLADASDPREAARALVPLVVGASALEQAVGQVSELAWADPPHHAAGCVAQAFSVAELLDAVRRLEAALS